MLIITRVCWFAWWIMHTTGCCNPWLFCRLLPKGYVEPSKRVREICYTMVKHKTKGPKMAWWRFLEIFVRKTQIKFFTTKKSRYVVEIGESIKRTVAMCTWSFTLRPKDSLCCRNGKNFRSFKNIFFKFESENSRGYIQWGKDITICCIRL
jgi:hypothetical protein